MKKQIIRLTENDLHRIIENSVKRVLKEKKRLTTDDLKVISSKKIENKYNTYKGYIIKINNNKCGEIYNSGNNEGFIGTIKYNNKNVKVSNCNNKKDTINKLINKYNKL